MAVKKTGLGKGLDSMIPPKATPKAVKGKESASSKTGETILKINETSGIRTLQELKNISKIKDVASSKMKK